MLFKDIAILDENFDVKEHMNVAVKGKFIDYIGRELPEGDYGEIYNGRNRLLIPSFCNEHTHLTMMFMRGYGESLPLMDWLTTKIFPFEDHLTPEDNYYGAMMGIAEMLRYGIGSARDMYLNFHHVGRAFADSGIKGCFARAVTYAGPDSYYDLPIYQETLDAVKEFNTADNDRFRSEISLHAEYTNSEEVTRCVAEVAKANKLSMHVHVSETEGEVEECRQRHEGRSPVKYLYDCGIFDMPTTAAHCVWLDDDDIAILREKKVSVATCPKSNAKLGSGVCDVSSLLKSGVNVAVGTDSVASNNNLNMLEEVRFLSLMQKAVKTNPVVITPKEMLYAATRAGALAEQREDSGLIKEGFRADIAVFATDRVYMKPQYDLLNNIAYAASGNDVVMTMVDGHVLYRDGEYTTIDIERVEYEAERIRQRIIGEL